MKRPINVLWPYAFALVVAGPTIGLAVACASATGSRGDEYNTANLSTETRADYDVFSNRCSKCHALSRVFNAGAQSDVFWENYVTRMRRMPGSGISAEDTSQILRFLHYYSTQGNAKPADTSLPLIPTVGLSGSAPSPVAPSDVPSTASSSSPVQVTR